MSTIRHDFDCIALVSEEGATHNDHYHNFLLRHLPAKCGRALEIGCGTGGFARRLAERCEHVLALDLSPEMIRLARERSVEFPNIEFKLADVLDLPLPAEQFDCIASIATLHHLPIEEMLLRMKAALKPGGVLLILDLFEAARLRAVSRGSSASVVASSSASRSAGSTALGLAGLNSLWAGLSDSLLNLVAIPVSVGLRLIHHGRLLPRREERAAWSAHEHHDTYPTMHEVHALCDQILPGAKIKKHLLWRYSIVWEKAG